MPVYNVVSWVSCDLIVNDVVANVIVRGVFDDMQTRTRKPRQFIVCSHMPYSSRKRSKEKETSMALKRQCPVSSMKYSKLYCASFTVDTNLCEMAVCKAGIPEGSSQMFLIMLQIASVYVSQQWASTLVFGYKSLIFKDKSGTDAVNAFEIYYTWFKIWSIKD